MFWTILPVGVYLFLLIFITFYTGRRSPAASGDADYFLAGRRLGPVFAFVSVVATETSVATVLVFPQAGFAGGLSLLWLCFGFIAGRYLVARFYLDRLYDRHRLSIYATVTGDDPTAGRWLSMFYLLAKFVSSGVRFYLGGVALASLFGQSLPAWILIMALLAGTYSMIGGLRAVVWTDQIQGYVILGMGVAVFAALATNVDFSIVSAPAWVNTDSALKNASFFPVLFLGGLVLSLGSHGADQDMLQRVLATSSRQIARRALVLSGLGATVVILLYLAVGWLLSVSSDQGVLDFAVSPKTPLVDYIAGTNLDLVTGMFAVLLIAAAMSTLDSAMHSTGAVWKSLLDPQNERPNRSGRAYSFLSLIVLVGFALAFIVVAERTRNFLDLAMSSMNYVNGGLIGVFTVFTLTRGRPVRATAVLGALAAGFFVTLAANFAYPWLGLADRPGWTYVTIASAAAATIVAWLLGKNVSVKNSPRPS